MTNDLTKAQKLTVAGVGIFTSGAILGWLTRRYVKEEQTTHADDILDHVKKEFVKESPIEGSWIELTPVPWKKVAYETDVYYGGISRLEGTELVQYEFMANAYTGTIMDIYKL